MTNKTFLVLGSNSFSGSNLIYKLLHDHPSNRVIGVSRSKENNGLEKIMDDAVSKKKRFGAHVRVFVFKGI